MNVRDRLKDRRVQRTVGLVALVLASLMRYLPRIAAVSPDLVDAGMGFFYGVAICCLLLSLRSDRRILDR